MGRLWTDFVYQPNKFHQHSSVWSQCLKSLLRARMFTKRPIITHLTCWVILWGECSRISWCWITEASLLTGFSLISSGFPALIFWPYCRSLCNRGILEPTTALFVFWKILRKLASFEVVVITSWRFPLGKQPFLANVQCIRFSVLEGIEVPFADRIFCFWNFSLVVSSDFCFKCSKLFA